MATVTLHPMFMSMKGNTGRFIHYTRLGKQCIRIHVIPSNPKSEAQQKNRRTFAEGVKSWKSLTPQDKYIWERKAYRKGITGYNLFMSEFLKQKLHIEIPAVSIDDSSSLQGFSSGNAGIQCHTRSASFPLLLRSASVSSSG